MKPYILGLDLGSNSIGWALISNSEEDRKNGQGIIDLGVRVFPEGVDRDTKGSELSKNAKRREARGSRRQRERRIMRRETLVKVLRRKDLLPKSDIQTDEIFQRNPYQLRSRGLNEKLELHEFGRVIFHLNQRRGFKSNRKSGKTKEDGKVNTACNELQKDIEKSGCRTLGEYLAGLDPEQQRYRNRYTFRNMYEHEFKLLWEKQQQFYPDNLTDELKQRIQKVLFFQRPLKPCDELIGDCELEPGEKRCPRGDGYARRYRLLQDVNNLEITHRAGTSHKLNEEQRKILLDYLGKHKERTFDQIRKELGLLETDRFNFEDRDGHKKMKGDEFGAAMSGSKIFGKKVWANLEEEEKRSLNDAVLELDDDELMQKMESEYGFDENQIESILKVGLPKGYMSFSRKAIQKLLPYMEQGQLVHKAIESAKYDRNKTDQSEFVDFLDVPPDLRNPIVNQTLVEVRKVVNAILHKYGKPAKIKIEMARDLKNNKRQRDEISRRQYRNQQKNEEARQELITEMGIASPRRDDIIKYKLWRECHGICPFTGKSISQHQLFGATPEFQIEHILPYKRSLDDSYMNKTLCFVEENRVVKGDHTPFEAYHSDPERYDSIKQRISDLPWPKRQRFLQQELDLDKCIERKLNDTRYISREVLSYLKKLVVNVMGSRGEATFELRNEWGLNSILNLIGDTKNRDDHRHHAVDALVVALTEPKHLRDLARFRHADDRKAFPSPWNHFRQEAEAKVNRILVSHRVRRKVSGALHEETSYGPTRKENVYVYRKKLEDLTLAMVKKIRDGKVREIVENRLQQHGIDPESKGDRIPKEVWNDPLYMYSKKGKQIPIRKVRIEKVSTNVIPIKDREGKIDYYRVQKMDINGMVRFRHHTAVSVGKENKLYIDKTAHLFNGRKICVDPLGCDYPASD